MSNKLSTLASHPIATGRNFFLQPSPGVPPAESIFTLVAAVWLRHYVSVYPGATCAAFLRQSHVSVQSLSLSNARHIFQSPMPFQDREGFTICEVPPSACILFSPQAVSQTACRPPGASGYQNAICFHLDLIKNKSSAFFNKAAMVDVLMRPSPKCAIASFGRNAFFKFAKYDLIFVFVTFPNSADAL